MFIEINTFDSIIIENKKTLVICDIDNTILYQKSAKTIEEIYKILKGDLEEEDLEEEIKEEDLEEEIKEEAIYYYRMLKSISKPICTDFIGFTNLEKIIKKLDGEIIFLTARNSSSETYTKKQFNDIGIDYNNYHVHYTNDKITKGNYIKNNIDLTEFENIVFIDDYDTNISSVNEYNNNILCYKFVIDGLGTCEQCVF